MYDGKETNKLKGTKKNVVQKEIRFDDFRKCLLTEEPIYKKQNIFRCKLHNVYAVEQNKKAVSAHDDERHILENGIDTLAWGIIGWGGKRSLTRPSKGT